MSKYRVIYEPSGRAREYSQLALNVYNGCGMGCKYCYVPRITRKNRDEFHKNTKIRNSILEKLEKDLHDMKNNKDERMVMLSFTSDVYQLDDKFNSFTREILKMFNKYKQPFHILTKGGLRAVRDFDLYKNSDWFACSLTFLDDVKSKKIEPNASLPLERIESLKIAKEKGIKTWVSFEPVLDEEEVYKLYELSKKYVDFYKIGKVSGYKNVNVDWDRFVNKIVEMLEKDNKRYFIKYDLRPHLKKDVSEYKYHREMK